jgi:hypothetical protein
MVPFLPTGTSLKIRYKLCRDAEQTPQTNPPKTYKVEMHKTRTLNLGTSKSVAPVFFLPNYSTSGLVLEWLKIDHFWLEKGIMISNTVRDLNHPM